MNINQPSTNVIVQPSKVSLLRFSFRFLFSVLISIVELNNQSIQRKETLLEQRTVRKPGFSDPALRPVWMTEGLVVHGSYRTISPAVMLTGAGG